MSEEQIWQLVVLLGAPVVAAVIAAASAVIRRGWERRDVERSSRRLIEQATKQTEFVNSWLSAHEKLGGETAVSDAHVSAMALSALDRAYTTAIDASHLTGNGHDRSSWSKILIRKLESVFLLGEAARSHFLLVGTFYLLVLFSWVGVFEGESESDPDYTTLSSDLAFAIIGTVVLRIVFGLLIAWRERRKSDGDEAEPTPTPVPPIPPPSG